LSPSLFALLRSDGTARAFSKQKQLTFYFCKYICTIGKSTHNQRIERLWRDVFEGCLSLFYQIFQYLETQNLLNVDDDIHMWCLRFVYLPMLNNHLQIWKSSWVHHPLRTAGNKSPMQLWILGLHSSNFGHRAIGNNQEPLTEVTLNDTNTVDFEK
jgi:hypothetical protein